MVKILAGEKGEGKTKKLINMANDASVNAGGVVVYIDDDSRHIYDLKHSIRFVEVAEFPLVNYRELVGFIYGILSQNSDIEDIFIDGIYKIVEKLDNEDMIKLMTKLNAISEKYSINFTISANVNPNDLPKEISNLLI
ncbi:MAG: twitching motility protein PilT [Lachnospirales bacterium]